jgi:hypothetical protein
MTSPTARANAQRRFAETNVVYHFTDTIICRGSSRPKYCVQLNRVSKLPFEFLWATINPNGDRTCAVQASSSGREAFRRDLLQYVRFTLPGEHFNEWRDLSRLHPEWNAEQIARTEQAARDHGEIRIDNWRFRRDPLPLCQVLAVHAKSCQPGQWVPADDALRSMVVLHDMDDGRGIIIGDEVYTCQKLVLPDGRVGYRTLLRSSVSKLKTQGLVLEGTEDDLK